MRRPLNDAEKARALDRIRHEQPPALVAQAFGMSLKTLRKQVGEDALQEALQHARVMRAVVDNSTGSGGWQGRKTFNLESEDSTRTWEP